jgi:signal transduction histidine kinase
MESSSRAKKLRLAFLILACMGFIVNLGFDIKSVHEAKQSHFSARSIGRSYDNILRAEVIDRTLDEIKTMKDMEAIGPHVLTELNIIEDQVTYTPNQQARLQIVEESVREKNFKKLEVARIKITDFVTEETAIASQRFKKEDLETEKIIKENLATVIIDTFLIVLMISLVGVEWYLRSRTEKNLLSSLQLLRVANGTLQEESYKKDIAKKAIIHDLKNPLGSIYGFAELLKDEAPRNTSVMEFSDTILRISKTTLQLVEGLLAESRQHTKLQPIEVNGILQEVVMQAQGQARAKKQVIVSQIPATARIYILGDRIKFEEIIFNLIGNAIKYSPRGTKIGLTCKSEDGFVEIQIEDEGPGFTAADKTKAFQYGQVLSARPTGGESSTGIGLYLVKQLVELHHGNVEIRDRAGKRGTIVFLRFPQTQVDA